MRINRDYFWFRLFKTRGIGSKLLIRVAEILEAENINPEMLPSSQNDLTEQFPKLAKIINGKIREEDTKRVTTVYEQLKIKKFDILYPGHPNFPPHLREISPILFVKGQQKHILTESVTIVGARNVSEKGIHIARKLAGDLASKGINIVSGYAKGVDSEAHLGALEADGTTTIVLSNGINQLHQKNAFKDFNWDRDILTVSQFDPDSKWQAYYAIERNKLVCALSKAVVVIESGPKQDAEGKRSGTFITAKTALELNLPLFVIDPNCLDNPPKGNIDLIKLGGYSLDPTNGAKEIVERALIKTEECVPTTNQNSAQ